MSDDEQQDGSLNQVLLRGRLAEAPETKALPSGDVMTVFRLTVDRPPGSRVRVDSLECVSTRARARKTLERCNPGDVVEVSGSLRRRFWRGGPAGPTSRYAVDVSGARIVRRAGSTGPPTAASRARKPASA